MRIARSLHIRWFERRRRLVQQEKRAAPRVKLRGPTEYRNAGVEGHGTVWDISASGALIEAASQLIEPGERIGLRSSFFPGSFDIELRADVVRHTETGFAVQFVELGAPQIDFLRRVLPGTAAAALDQ
jgi:hypothetical protein